MQRSPFYPQVESYCTKLVGELDLIAPERKEQLAQIGNYISQKAKHGEPARFTVICTHNSRRSHFGQVWLAVAASFFGIHVEAFSGGTEATAVHPNAVEALRRAGLAIERFGTGANPVYAVKFGPGYPTMRLFSKKYDDPSNPQKDFAAIMVCSEADAGCPFVPGASDRFALPYLDPKLADGNGNEAQVYDARCQQIATEMMYVLGATQR